MKSTSILWASKAIRAAFLVAASVCASSALPIPPITPTTGDLNVTRWEGLETSQSDINIVINGIIGNSTELYKQNVGQSGDTGFFAPNYTTVFDATPTDPSEATVTWDGGAFIPASAYMLVKDGKQSPAWYLFDLSALGWDGMATLDLTGFWPNEGAISHVSFYSGQSDIPGVPDGSSTIAMLGVSFGVLGLLRGRRRVV
jgi:hypothetical protein